MCLYTGTELSKKANQARFTNKGDRFRLPVISFEVKTNICVIKNSCSRFSKCNGMTDDSNVL